jgi:hypothetical protein
VPAYAYRTKTKLHVFVPQGFGTPFDAFDPRMGARQGCGFAMMTVTLPGGVAGVSVLPPRAMKASERWLADLNEAFELEQKLFPKGRPAPPPSWTVNVSVSQVSRDPEPLMSVVVVAPREPAGRSRAPMRHGGVAIMNSSVPPSSYCPATRSAGPTKRSTTTPSTGARTTNSSEPSEWAARASCSRRS